MFARAAHLFAFIFQVIFLIQSAVAGPNISSPEDVSGCFPCCDTAGNSFPSHPECGCGPVNSCGQCSAHESTCNPTCNLFDCANNPLPNSTNFCHLDVNRDNHVTIEDANLVRDEVNGGRSSQKYDINRDGSVTGLDSLLVINFLNGPDNGSSVDECGVCGGPGPGACGSCNPNVRDSGCGCGNPAPSGCNLQCGSTAQVDVCGVCGGDGSSCQRQCRFYNIRLKGVHEGKFQGRNPQIFSGVGQDLVCIRQLLNQFSLSHNRPVSRNESDDELYRFLYNRFVGAGFSSRDVHTGAALMDELCQPVRSAVRPSEICGGLNFLFFATPVSLLVDPSTDLNEEGKLVRFRLNPFNDAQYVIWKASSKAPLLVYDPEKTGKVVDGSQLFGNWTFGGTYNLASLSNPILPKTKEWENGFEPLKLLDKDKNGVLEGGELDVLSLWYDENRDAISQEGEIRSLSSQSITKLILGQVEKLSNLNDLHIKKGFVMETGGHEHVGPMVDWVTRTYATSTEAIAYESLKIFEEKNITPSFPGTAISKKSVLKERDESFKTQKNESNYLKGLSSENFSGIWIWGVDGQENVIDSGKSTTGLITISDKGDSVNGHLYVEVPFEHINENKTYRHFTMKTFKGTKFINEADNKVGVRFELNDEQGVAVTKLFKGGNKNQLVGETKNIFKAEKGLPTSFEYAWKGNRWTVK